MHTCTENFLSHAHRNAFRTIPGTGRRSDNNDRHIHTEHTTAHNLTFWGFAFGAVFRSTEYQPVTVGQQSSWLTVLTPVVPLEEQRSTKRNWPPPFCNTHSAETDKHSPIVRLCAKRHKVVNSCNNNIYSYMYDMSRPGQQYIMYNVHVFCCCCCCCCGCCFVSMSAHRIRVLHTYTHTDARAPARERRRLCTRAHCHEAHTPDRFVYVYKCKVSSPRVYRFPMYRSS